MKTPSSSGFVNFTPARFDNGKVNIEASLVLAREALEKFAQQDDDNTVKIGEAALRVWDNSKYSSVRFITPNALARMALDSLGVVPDDKACRDAVSRVKNVLAGKPDKFIFIKKGPRKGFHHRERYSEVELSNLLASSK